MWSGRSTAHWTLTRWCRYIALQHAELAVDMVVEDDGPAILNSYRLIFLADSHVTDTASSALVAWVSAGGTLVATAGAGCFNEFNATNTKLTALLGIVTCDGMYEPSSSKVQYEKQELIHATALDTVSFAIHNDTTIVNTSTCEIAGAGSSNDTFDCGNVTYGCDSSCIFESYDCSRNVTNNNTETASCACTSCNYTNAPVNFSTEIFGMRHIFKPALTSDVIATFNPSKAVGASQPSPPAAAIFTRTGSGQSIYMAFLPGLSYFKPAMPLRPTDRGGMDYSYTHFIPSNFSNAIMELIHNVSRLAQVIKPVMCSTPRVHGKPVVSSKGVVVPLVNWAGGDNETYDNITNLTVTLNITGVVKQGMKVSLASGGAVEQLPSSGTGGAEMSFVLNLSVADALILR